MLYQNYSPNPDYDCDYEAGDSDATGKGDGASFLDGAGSYNDDGNGSGKGDGAGAWCNLSPILASGKGSGRHIGYMDNADSGYAGGGDTGWNDPST